MRIIALGKNEESKSITGKIINLFIKDPFVIAQIAGSSREKLNEVDFSAVTAISSLSMIAVFFMARDVSSANIAMFLSIAKNPIIC